MSIAERVREIAGLADDEGPPDVYLEAAVRGFAEAFNFWYIRVVQNAVAKYRTVIISRINPFIRRIEFEGLPANETAKRLVYDWGARNFVTAGGWALEEMAGSLSPDAQKSTAKGLDLQRHDPATSDWHLYVLKSSNVTRNSDIVDALKRNARSAEKLLLQGRSTGSVRANWVVLAGRTSSTFEDGIWRPSSGEFWAEMCNLSEDKAVPTVMAVAAAAGELVRMDAQAHLAAMETLVATYIASPEDPSSVDWEFIGRRTLLPKDRWNTQDKARHKAALAAVRATGYEL